MNLDSNSNNNENNLNNSVTPEVPTSVEPVVTPTSVENTEPVAESVMTATPVVSSEPVVETPVPPVTPTNVSETTPVTPVVETQVAPVAPVVNTQEQTVYNTQAPVQKKNKSLLIIIIIVVLLAGCGVGYYFFFLNDSNSKVSIQKEVKTPDGIAKKYIEYVINEKYSDAYKLLDISSDAFVNDNDYKQFIESRDYYEFLKGAKVSNVKETSKTDKEIVYNVTLKNKEETKTIDVYMNKVDDSYKVNEKDFLIKWAIFIPGDAEFYIDGTLVPETLKVSSEDKYFNKYEIMTYKTTKEIKVVTAFQEEIKTITPLNSNSGEKFTIELNEEERNKAYAAVKTLWNNLYADYANKVDVSVIKEKYFDPSVDIENVNQYYKTCFDELIKSTFKNNSNFILMTMVPGKEKNMIVKNNVVTLYFGYHLEWNWDYNGQLEGMERYSNIRLVKGDDGSYKIYEVTDSKLFSWANQFTSDFKLQN